MSKVVATIAPISCLYNLSAGNLADRLDAPAGASTGGSFLAAESGDVVPTASTGDASVLSLFRRWIDEHRARAASGDDRDAVDAAIDRECEIEHKIADTPAEGPIGLAIKLYLSLHADHYAFTLGAEPAGLEGFDPGIYGDNPERYVEAHSIAAALRDAARFVPEIAILAKAMIGEPPAAELAGIGDGSVPISCRIYGLAVDK